MPLLHTVPSTAVLPMDRHLDTDSIFSLSTLNQKPIDLIQTLESLTAHHLGTAMDPPSQDHSWPVLTTSAPTRSKSSMKLPNEFQSS